MTKHRKQPDSPARRQFLRGVAVIGGVAGVSALTGQAFGETEEPETGAQPVPGKGYQESDHIRTYYDKARL